jgi:hypothetical protein
MKNAQNFKTLVDIFFALLFVGVVGVMISLPFAHVEINSNEIDPSSMTWIQVISLVMALFATILFIRGSFYFRQVARFLLENRMFTNDMAISLSKAGQQYVYAGLIYIVLMLFLGLTKMVQGTVHIDLGALLPPFFLCVVGLFFKLQSQVLLQAKALKEENQLTI